MLTSVSVSPSFRVAAAWPLSYEPPTTPISTDFPSPAIETTLKMFSLAGKVPLSATVSQTPFVEIKTLVGRAGGGVGVVDVDVGVEVVPPAAVVAGGAAGGVGEGFGTVDAGVVCARVVVVTGG